MAHNLWEYVNENVDNGNGEKIECVANLPKPTAALVIYVCRRGVKNKGLLSHF